MLIRELTDGGRTLTDLTVDQAAIPNGVRDVLETFRTAAALPPESLGAYVITMASRPSDVLAVELLQRLAGTAIRSGSYRCLRPAPICSAPAPSSTRSSRIPGIGGASPTSWRS